MQIGLLLESQLAGKPALNVLQLVTHFTDEVIDVAAMRQAWQEVTLRNDVLRTVLDPLAENGPQQYALDAIEVDFLHLDWSAMPADEQAIRLPIWLEQDRCQGVDLTKVPSWRVRMVQLAANHMLMVVTIHHAMMDGGSFFLLQSELYDRYNAYRDHRPLRLTVPEVSSFLDHCRALVAQDVSAGQAFFRDHLAGFDEPNRLANCFLAAEGDAGISQSSRMVSTRLSQSTSEAIRARAKRAGVTTANVITAAWGLVLARASGRDEALFGITRTGRHMRPGEPPCVGCLINTLPFRTRISGRTLDEYLREHRAFVLATRDLEQMPLPAIAEVCDIPGGQGFFDSLVMFDRKSAAQYLSALGPEWDKRHGEERSQMATGLTLGVYDDPEMLVRLEYDPGRFSDAGMARLSRYMIQTLHSIIACDDVPLAQVAVLPENEIADLIALGQPRHPLHLAQDHPALIQEIEQVARTQPDHIALTQIGLTQIGLTQIDLPGPDLLIDQSTEDAATLSYGLLDQRANHLAAVLRSKGIGPGDIIGLALPRGFDFIVAMLAVLKAEAAFLPLDPEYPVPLLAHMIKDSGAALVLSVQETVAACADLPVARLDLDAPGNRGLAADPPPRGPHDPERPAYVIYTSGSTGLPKGVLVPHRALSHHAHATRAAYGISRDDHVLQFASLNFDISIEEILPSLLAGAGVMLRDIHMAQSIPDFLAEIDAHQITLTNLPTAFWHVLIAHLGDMDGRARLPGSLRLMVVGGERISGAALTSWQEKYPEIRWLNGYGPTETTITATLYDPSLAPFDGGEVPVGRPTDSVHVYVILPDGSLAPEGVNGELWIGGPQIALGYIGQPSLSQKAFVPDPFAPQTRMAAPLAYRSGDCVSWRPDGQLAYHGRIDKQVKLRGYRIELSAIEANLEATGLVETAIVALEGARTPQAHLVAWVRPHHDHPDVDSATILKAIQPHLPPHTLPRIVLIDHIPQTPGGKIDLAQLPRPALVQEPSQSFGPPDESTQKVQSIFAELLHLDEAGPDQSFFDLGGNSLISVRLMSLLEREFGKRLTLATLYQSSTPREIAAEIQTMDSKSEPNCLVPIQPNGSLAPLFAVHIIGSGGDFFRPLARHLGEDQPIYGLTLDLLDPSSPTSLPEIAEIYRNTAERIAPHGPIRLIAVSQGSYAAYEMAQQLLATGRDVAALYLLDAAGPGGRVQKFGRKSLRHYLSRLRHNFAGVASGRWHELRMELHFRCERLKLRLARALGSAGNRYIRSITAHQAAIDLAIRSYKPTPYPREITVFRAADNLRDGPEVKENGLGWSIVAPKGVRIIDTAGQHLTMLGEPYVHELAAHLRLDMKRDN